MRKRFRPITLVFTMLLIACLFLGCSYSKATDISSSENAIKTPSDAPTNEVDKDLPLKISYKVYSDTVKDSDGTALVKFRFSYPYIENPNDAEGIAAINDYYQGQLNNFINAVIPEWKNIALEVKKDAEEMGFDFYTLAYERDASIYYNGNQLLSVLFITFENAGGAHPMTYWSSDTFDVKTGKLLTLSDIFGVSRDEALEKVYEVAINQIEATNDEDNYYFENYEENVRNYSDRDFVLGQDGIIFYYQPYTIAPYVAGIPTFKLPYEKAGDLAIKILPLSPNDLEREVYSNAGRLIEANKEVFYNIFGLAMLPLELPENIPAGQSVFPVKDFRFGTFSDLDAYIRGIYIKSEADMLMNSGRYINKDGELYGDISKDAGMGYYVDWNNYRYEVSNISETNATITIYTTDESPAGREDKIIHVKMLKENDRWLLENMFY